MVPTPSGTSGDFGREDFGRDDLGVSKNNGTPKSSILIGFSIINNPFWGTPIFGNIHFDEIPKIPRFGLAPQAVGANEGGEFFPKSCGFPMFLTPVFHPKNNEV